MTNTAYTSEGIRIRIGDRLTDKTMTKVYEVKKIDSVFVYVTEILTDSCGEETEGEKSCYSYSGTEKQLYFWE